MNPCHNKTFVCLKIPIVNKTKLWSALVGLKPSFLKDEAYLDIGFEVKWGITSYYKVIFLNSTSTSNETIIFLSQGKKFSKKIIYAYSKILKFLLDACFPGSFVGCCMRGWQTLITSCQSDTPLETLDTSGSQQLPHRLNSWGLKERPWPLPEAILQVPMVVKLSLWCKGTWPCFLFSLSTREKVLECVHMCRSVEWGF